jgi:hypothetical protein
MQALFTGGLGDFIGAECFMSEAEKDSVKTVLWATRNREEIKAAVDLKSIFPNMVEEKILFDDFCDERPTRDWQPGDRFMNIGKKSDLNLKCGLNLSQAELDAISDHSLDATLEDIFSGRRKWQSSRIATRKPLPDVDGFNLPQQYVAIHPWSDAEINGREFNEHDWPSIYAFLEKFNLTGVVVNQSKYPAPKHARIIDLTNQTTLQETFNIIQGAESCILCASSLACYATKIFPKDRIWLKGGFEHMFTAWATHYYHGPFTAAQDIIFKNLKVLDRYQRQVVQSVNPDNGYMSLL